jgi:hypothetical protein
VVFGVVGGRKTAEEKDGDDGKEPTITTTSARGGGISTVTENDDVGRTKNQTVSAMAAISPTRDSINRRQPTTLTKPSFPANIATAFSSSNITWSALATLDLGIGEAREATRLLTKPLFGRVRSPAFMPDGRRVLFSSDHDSGQLGFPADGFPRQRTLYMTTGEGDTVAQVLWLFWALLVVKKQIFSQQSILPRDSKMPASHFCCLNFR